MIRALLLVMSSLAENEDAAVLLAIITFSIVSLTMFGITGGVYTKHWLNILEISFTLNLGVLSAAQLYLSTPNAHAMAKIKDMGETIIAYTSVTIAFITFLGIITFHIYERVKKQRKIKEAIHKMKKKLKKKEAIKE